MRNLLVVVVAACGTSSAPEPGVLASGDAVVDGAPLVSCGGVFTLAVDNGQLTLAHGDDILWSVPGSEAQMRDDGDFVVTDAAGNVTFESGTHVAGAYLVVGNGGFLTVEDDHRILWVGGR
jgi:hypothetical protein